MHRGSSSGPPCNVNVNCIHLHVQPKQKTKKTRPCKGSKAFKLRRPCTLTPRLQATSCNITARTIPPLAQYIKVATYQVRVLADLSELAALTPHYPTPTRAQEPGSPAVALPISPCFPLYKTLTKSARAGSVENICAFRTPQIKRVSSGS